MLRDLSSTILPLALGAICLAHGSGCGEDKIALGEPCTQHGSCESGECLLVPDARGDSASLLCTRDCSPSDPCPVGTVCGPSFDGTNKCIPPCGYFDDRYNWPANIELYTCEGEIPVPCSQTVTSDHCLSCGCPEGEVCSFYVDYSLGQECIPLLEDGAVCEYHGECTTSNCGDPEDDGTTNCILGLGESCTDANCEICAQDGEFCTRRCSGDYGDCPDEGNFICIGSDEYYTCHVNCGMGTCSAWDDPWGCSPYPSLCPSGQNCEPLLSNGYACMW